MSIPGMVLDLGLVAAMIWLAVRALAEAKLFKSAVLFISFGLLTALTWVRLAAPDIALAEAAIGAGITGALVLDAVGHLRGRGVPFAAQDTDGPIGSSAIEGAASDAPGPNAATGGDTHA